MIFSNDPRDIVRDLLKKGLAEMQQSQGQPDPDKVVTRDNIGVTHVKSPSHGPSHSPMAFLTGATIGFWYNFLKSFWYWIPLFMGILYFTVVNDPEAMAEFMSAGMSVKTMGWGILTNGILATLLSFVPTYFIGTRLRAGIPVQRSTITMLTLPSLLFGAFALYNVAWVFLLAFFV